MFSSLVASNASLEIIVCETFLKNVSLTLYIATHICLRSGLVLETGTIAQKEKILIMTTITLHKSKYIRITLNFKANVL